MVSLAQAVERTVHEQVDVRYPLPSLLQSTISVFDAWDYIQNFHWIRRNGNANHLVYAGGAFVTAEFLPMGQKAITYLLALKCTQDLVQQHLTVYRSLQNLKAALFNQYPCYQRVKWSTEDSRTFGFAASTYLWAKVKMIHLWQRLRKIVQATFIVLKETFLLSKRYREMYKIMELDPHTRLQGLAEISANYHDYCRSLQENGLYLLDCLRKKEKKIDGLLNKMNDQDQTKGWIHSLSPCYVKTPPQSPSLLSRTYQAGKDLIAPIFEPGKSQGYNLDISSHFLENYMPQATAKTLSGPYPPWRGQKLPPVTPKKTIVPQPSTPVKLMSPPPPSPSKKFSEHLAESVPGQFFLSIANLFSN
jgi:hypothetical protein